MRPERDTGLPALAEVIQRAREAAGLSQADLAEQMGVSRVTIREAELGRDPRAATLAALREALPELSPGELLPSPHASVPPASFGVWRFVAEAQGFSVRRLRRLVLFEGDGRASVRVELRGVRPAARRFTGESGALALGQTVALGSSRLLARLGQEGGLRPGASLSLEDEGALHEFRAAAQGRRGLDYRVSFPPSPLAHPWETDAAEAPDLQTLGLAIALEFPVETLELVLKRPPELKRASAASRAWPSSLTPDSGTDLLDSLHGSHGSARLESAPSRLRLIVEHPVIGLSYGLGWSHAMGAPDFTQDPPSDLAETLRHSRERAGLSRRGLAGAMGASAMTVVEAERGRDPRRSTLLRWLAALPDLSPWSLLPVDAGARRGVAWEHAAAIHGSVAELEEKTVRITAEGHSHLRIETEGLRLAESDRGDIRVRLGHARSVLQASHAAMRSVEAEESEEGGGLRISRVSMGDGPALHELRIPASIAQRGASFARKLEHRGIYVMRAERARELTGQEGPFYEGTSFGALVPTRRLRLIVRIPRGWWPEQPRAHAWPLTQVPDPDHPDASALLHPEGLDVEVDRRRRRLVLEVEHPLVGFKYAMSWRLPG